MTDSSLELLEKVARAISRFKGRDPDECVFGYGLNEEGKIPCLRRAWENEVPEARAVLTAIGSDMRL